MRLNERLKLRVGMSTKELAEYWGVSINQVRSWDESKPKFFEVGLVGIEQGSQWIDFQDDLEKDGITLTSCDGSITYTGKNSEFSNALKKYGVPSVNHFCRFLEVGRPYANKLYKENNTLYQSLFHGMTYILRFRPVKNSLKKNIKAYRG